MDSEAKVTNVIKAPNKQHLHSISVLYGEIKVGDKVTLSVDVLRRQLIMRNHSSVHLLQAALMEVLGDHINQKGSYVCDQYVHFDFSHDKKMSEEEITTVEKKVNTWISEAIPEETKVLAIEEAKKIGAKALFDEKYGDVVRVVCFGEVSKEFCGGTHVKNTSDIGLFVIESEESVASGVRRIVARTSIGAYELLKKRENLLIQARNNVGAGSIYETNSRITSIINERNELKRQVESLSMKLANSEAKSLEDAFEKVNDIEKLVKSFDNTDRNALLSLADKLKVGHPDSYLLLIGTAGDNISIICSVNGKAQAYLKAGDVVRQVAGVLGGSGGGRPDFANGAGRDKSKINDALLLAKGLFK